MKARFRIQTPGGIVPPLQERGPVPRLLGMELLRATKRQFVNDLINLTLTSLDMVGVLGGDREVGLAAGPTQGASSRRIRRRHARYCN